jgi:hypothetical protein
MVFWTSSDRSPESSSVFGISITTNDLGAGFCAVSWKTMSHALLPTRFMSSP